MNANAFSPLASVALHAPTPQPANSAGGASGAEGKDEFARMLDQASPPRAERSERAERNEGAANTNAVKKPSNGAEKERPADPADAGDTRSGDADADQATVKRAGPADAAAASRRAANRQAQGSKQMERMDAASLTDDTAAAAAQALVDSLAGRLQGRSDSTPEGSATDALDPTALLAGLNTPPADAAVTPNSWDASALALMAAASTGPTSATALLAQTAGAAGQDQGRLEALAGSALQAGAAKALDSRAALAGGRGAVGAPTLDSATTLDPSALATPGMNSETGLTRAGTTPVGLPTERLAAAGDPAAALESGVATAAGKLPGPDSRVAVGANPAGDRLAGGAAAGLQALRDRGAALGDPDAGNAIKLAQPAAASPTAGAGLSGAASITGTAAATAGDLERLGLSSANAGSVMAQVNGPRRDASAAQGSGADSRIGRAEARSDERGAALEALGARPLNADASALPDAARPGLRTDTRQQALAQAAELPTTLALARAEPGLIDSTLGARLGESSSVQAGSGILAGSASTAPGALAWVAPTPGGLNAAASAAPTDGRIAASPGAPDFAPQLAAHITTFVRDGMQQARLELNPAEMGPLTVQIQLDGNAARVHLAAENAQTRQALEQAMPQLAGSLRESGLTLSGGGVFEQPRQPQQQAQAGANGQGNGSRRGDDDGRRGTRSAALGAVNGLDAAATGTTRRRTGVVDLIA